jgi:hypothetical protein
VRDICQNYYNVTVARERFINALSFTSESGQGKEKSSAGGIGHALGVLCHWIIPVVVMMTKGLVILPLDSVCAFFEKKSYNILSTRRFSVNHPR